MSNSINNLNIKKIDILDSPAQLKSQLPLSDKARANVFSYRQQIIDIEKGQDKRLLVICGPCSIHDIKAAKDYALRLKELNERYSDKLFIVMRVYFEKPRTHIGWKGFINDPELDGSFDVNSGLRRARGLLLWLAENGIPAASEALDPISPQYIADLICWSAIGARTTESQTHREMASGLSMPVGFKNGTDGSLDVAINALIAAASEHNFMGIDNNGKVALLKTKGNPNAHIILRGGKKPNYHPDDIAKLETQLTNKSITPRFIIDCSHGNSNKNFKEQTTVLSSVSSQIVSGNSSIFGVMLESFIEEGNQAMKRSKESLIYGKSITDACISWETTETLLKQLHQTLTKTI